MLHLNIRTTYERLSKYTRCLIYSITELVILKDSTQFNNITHRVPS